MNHSHQSGEDDCVSTVYSSYLGQAREEAMDAGQSISMTYTGAPPCMTTSQRAGTTLLVLCFSASQIFDAKKKQPTTTEKVLLLVMFLAIGGSGASLFMSDSSHIASYLSSQEQQPNGENGLAMHQPMQLALASLPGSLVGESACPPEGRYEQQATLNSYRGRSKSPCQKSHPFSAQVTGCLWCWLATC